MFRACAQGYTEFHTLLSKVQTLEQRHAEREREFQLAAARSREQAEADRNEARYRYEEMIKRKDGQIAKYARSALFCVDVCAQHPVGFQVPARVGRLA
jgi:hypothetical protein